MLTYSHKLSCAYAFLTVRLRLDLHANALIYKAFREIKNLTYTSDALFTYAPENFSPCVGCVADMCAHILVKLNL